MIDLIIEFENVTKEELWDLYKLTKKKLDQEIKDHKDTNLAYDVLKDEFTQIVDTYTGELKSERLAHESTRRICKIGGDVSAEKIKELEGQVKELEDRIWRLHLIP